MKRLAPALALISAVVCGPAMAQLNGDLDNLEAQIWTDPNGCQHWYLDDGAEGYLTPRLNRDGTPVCPGVTPATYRNAQNAMPVYTIEVALWTDRLGCQHWVSDRGMTGFLSARLNPQGGPVCPGKQTRVITLDADALFDTDQSDLRPEAIAELNAFGARMQQLGKTRVRVEGHTDSRGSDAYNQALSERRASAVATYLERNFGIRAETRGFGELSPVATNDTEAGRQANRRVDITLLD